MEVERDEVRNREKMRVVGTQKGPAREDEQRGSARGQRIAVATQRTVEIWYTCEHVGDIVLSRDERLPTARQDGHRVHVKVSGVYTGASLEVSSCTPRTPLVHDSQKSRLRTPPDFVAPEMELSNRCSAS